MERLDAQLSAKDREIATITRTVRVMIFVTSNEVQANLCWLDNPVDAVHMFYA